MSNKVIVLIGVAGSGKTTYAKSLIAQNKNHNPVIEYVNADKIRFQMLNSERTGKYFDQSIESEVWEKTFNIYKELLIFDNDIIFDATNLTFERRYKIVAFAHNKRYINKEKSIEFVYFNIPLAEILKRNKSRKRIVEDSVIAKQFSQIQYPEIWEFDKITIITENTQANIDMTKIKVKKEAGDSFE